MSFSNPFEFHKGDRLADMTVVMPIARGGHGDLYLVCEDDDQKKILKVIQSPNNGKELTGIEKCLAVARHIPGLVPILKTGRLEDGRFYCVMPPADNLTSWPDYEPDTLDARIKREGRIRPDEMLRLSDKLLTTVKELHMAGLAHCDIKPENILFIAGEPKLTDCSLLSFGSSDLQSGSLCGSVGFVPPEMLDNPRSYNPQACDLYALGKVIYCAWSGADVALFPSIPREKSLQEIGIMLPVYMKACSGFQDERFKNADEFMESIAEAKRRMHSRYLTQGKVFVRRHLWSAILCLLLVFCTTVLMNCLFYSCFRPGDGISDPLEVTTTKDIVDAKDGLNSFREALEFVRSRGIQTVSFNMLDGDAIFLKDPSLISRNARISSTNKATGNPVNIVLDRLNVSKKVISTPDTEDGGGAVLYSNGGCFTINGGVYADNMDRGTGGQGGAIRIVNGTLTIDGTTFQRNFAYSAGGAVNVDFTQVSILRSVFDGNSSVGHGGAVDLYCSSARIIDSTFVSNSTKENPLYCWRGGAIQVDGSDLVYEVTQGTTITNAGNESGHGGFIVLCGTKGKATAEFRVDGTLNIGRGDGLDSFGSLYYDGINPDNNEKNIVVRKTGRGTMTVDAPVSDYDEQWIVEDGVLAFSYAPGGDFDGEIVIAGGRMRLDSPHRFRDLVFQLGSEPNAAPFVGNLFNLDGGLIEIDVNGCANGRYPLADGADDFNGAVRLRNTPASGSHRAADRSKSPDSPPEDQSAELSVGQTVKIGDFTYSLNSDGGVLSLTVDRERK